MIMDRNHVVVLHGLGMNRFWMAGISGHLKKQGLNVHSISYPSRGESFETLVDAFVVPAVNAVPGHKVDFVVHSMGGILVRLYALRHGAARIGRVVMLATPNKGSEVAEAARGWPVLAWFGGAALQGLGTTPGDIHARLPAVNFDCGVIAGNNPWLHEVSAALLHVPKPNDGVVSVESTRVEGMKDHIVISADHSQIVWSPKAWRLTAGFLATGSFREQAPEKEQEQA
jgi:pimeloyl-ACP methyl ester carboxylesterase